MISASQLVGEMAETPLFRTGDQVVHPKYPEWGSGVVDLAQIIKYQGKQGQRLTISFANHGRVTINTAVTPLQSKDAGNNMNNTTTPGWLDSIAEQNDHPQSVLWALPEAFTDPFTNLAKRLDTTLESFRFSTEARSLIDWAVAQTGMADPLSVFSRHDLEEAFGRFDRDRGLHLRDLVREIRSKGDRASIQLAMEKVSHDSARVALKRAML
jgi:hypothetical protein